MFDFVCHLNPSHNRHYRLPIDAYNDGEVSFSLSASVKRHLVFSRLDEEFSDDENADAGVEKSVKKSAVGNFFALVLSVMLLPLLFTYRMCSGGARTAAKFATRISRRWTTAKTDYNAFMSSNVESTELFTDDDDNDVVGEKSDRLIKPVPSETVPSPNFFRKIFHFFLSVTSSVTSRVTSFVPNMIPSRSSETEPSWIEVVVFRRIIRIFRFQFTT